MDLIASASGTSASATSTNSKWGSRAAHWFDELVVIGEGAFVREQHGAVGDRDDIVVECAGGNRIVGLLCEQGASGYDTVEPCDGAEASR